MFCPNCGSELKDGDIFCIKCGMKVPQIESPKSETAADDSIFIKRAETSEDSVFVRREETPSAEDTVFIGRGEIPSAEDTVYIPREETHQIGAVVPPPFEAQQYRQEQYHTQHGQPFEAQHSHDSYQGQQYQQPQYEQQYRQQYEEPQYRHQQYGEPQYQGQQYGYQRYEQQPQYRDYPEEYYDEPKEKKKTLLVILIAAGAVVLVAALVAIYFFVLKPNMEKQAQVEETTPYTTQETTTTEPETTTQETTTPGVTYPRTMYTTAEDGLLLREGPGKQYKAIYLINYGSAINVEKVENNWAYTTVAGLSGWCSCDYLTDKESGIKETTTAAGAVNPNKLVQPENTVEYGYHGTVSAKDGLMFRYGPGTQYEAFDKIPYGTEVAEEGWSGNWIYIQYNGRYGWVNSDYIAATGGMAKPAIYLYPQQRLDVSVNVKLSEGKFTITAPEYKNGWEVTAYPDGTIVDKASGKEYDYIYWESDSEPAYDWSEGYVVAGADTKEFLLEVLPKMGLIPAEYNEFINYWQPRMQKNAFNLITFQTDCYTGAAQMEISPKPDSLLRIFMAYKAVDGPVDVKTPEIKGFERKGFTVVEWGGAEVK